MQSITKANNVANPTHIIIMLTWYNHDDRQLAGEEIITQLNEQDILTIFDVPFWNHAYLCDAIENKQQLKIIQNNTQHIIQPQKHSYFLEMFKIEDQFLESQHG